mgnify:FL=1
MTKPDKVLLNRDSLQEAIVEEWRKDGLVPRGMYVLSGLASDACLELVAKAAPGSATELGLAIAAKEEAEGANILNRNAVRRLTESVEKLKAELKRNLDVLADSYSKTRAGRYASLSKEARQARLDLLTQIYSRMGGGLIHERADELDREEPLDESATGGSNVR